MIIIGASAAILAGGAGAGFFLLGGDSEEEKTEQQVTVSPGEDWNPYASEGHYSKTLSDFLISANGGKRIVKMTVTVDFASAEAFYRFQGYPDVETAETELAAGDEGGHGGGEEVVHITPMELKINDAINDLMLSAEAEQLTDRVALKTYLKDGINKALGFEEEIISEVYIENYVVQ